MPSIVGLGDFSNSDFKKVIKQFECSDDLKLFEYLKNNALTHHKQGLFQTYLFQDNEDYKGYISLASAQIAVDDTELRTILGVSNGVPYPISALKITRLCISDQFKRQQIGSLLVMFAEIAAYEQQNKIGCRALLVDAKEKAIGFYESLGFNVLGDMEDGICLMFKDIPSLRSKDIDHKVEQKEMVNEFIDFCEAFNLPHFAKTFEKILSEE
ncbi:MAG: GNAT family N-acetyltransferase [Sulfuricurvum sp.]|nr:GNAT family N-acetyltransferase [Sulfuricurvum sp.]